MIKNEKELLAELREASLLEGSPVTQKNGLWEIASRKETWEAIGPRLFDEHLDRFQKIAIKVLTERDPKFELEKEKRFAAGIYGKASKYSDSLRKGISETLALLGSFPELLTSCTYGKAEVVAALSVRDIFKDADWILWASLNYNLPILAEAAPGPFLDAVESSLSQSPCPFLEIYSQEGAGIMGQNYMSGLLWALETLAWDSDYLQRVTVILGDLAAMDPGGNWANRPSNSLRDIFLPWLPQTCALLPKRKAAITALVKEQPSVAWKLLISLLPSSRSSSAGCHKPKWRKFIPPEWSNNVTHAQYWEQVTIYSEILVEMAKKDSDRLPELVTQLVHLPEPSRTATVEHLISKPVVELPEKARLPIWENLTALVERHKRHSDAPWAMKQDAIAKVEAIAAALAPKPLNLLHHRLFSARDFELFEKKEDYNEQLKELEERRQAAVQQILESQKVKGLLEFVRSVKFPHSVGHALGAIDFGSLDNDLLPSLLNTEEQSIDDFIRGFVLRRYHLKGWPWVDSMLSSNWNTAQKANFLTKLPFVQGVWRRAESTLAEDQIAYWSDVRVHPFGPKDEILEAAEKLLKFNRPQAALSCLYAVITENEASSFPTEIAVRALTESLNSTERHGRLDAYEISLVIKWLQNNPSANASDLIRIEWSFIPLLDHEYGGEPKTLEKHMAAEPKFFCEVISTVFRSDKNEVPETDPSDSQRRIAENAFRLLHGWRTVPGRNSEGVFDKKVFDQWLEEVIKLTKESGHYRLAMNQFGQVLPYAPQDPDGLWIHRAVADALNAKDAGEMRSGFTTALFNQRGVHGFSYGQEERKLAADLNARADALEERGYQRLATAVRGLAKGYERDAEREAKKSPLED